MAGKMSKLTLNRETVRHLQESELALIRGGAAVRIHMLQPGAPCLMPATMGEDSECRCHQPDGDVFQGQRRDVLAPAAYTLP